MSDRPSFLIIVTGKGGLKLFSAHHTAEDASVARDSLEELGIQVHLIEVPQTEGVVKSGKLVSKPSPKAQPQPQPEPVTAVLPGKVVSQEQFEEQTRRLAKGKGERDGFRDDKYVGAFS